ncbi:MAG TPA: ComEA family DNA-binding protein [Nitrosomonas sp.]|nr:ComEA family DNA-binding protein [Nitrosomonas sp.]HQX13120.1 ComEA family DNA-binding protein [Nitrosomonas sp.]HRB20648.1 ComEA family DNA-binding protein [Nitrosomonas sp.]HRB32690.1 ComEA family DNA-binding protein [Nitrosomonas sp.]HRB45089.1 ComEA family DNA-binding protein [Nitrosomonas sp.]
MSKFFTVMFVVFWFSAIAHAATNINTASQNELESLQGIGPAKAKAIIEYREKNGSFASVEDLKKVPGIGDGTIKQLHDVITVGSEKSTESVKVTKKSDKE